MFSVELLVVAVDCLDSIVKLLEVNGLGWVDWQLLSNLTIGIIVLHQLLPALSLLSLLSSVLSLPLLGLLLLNFALLFLLILLLHLLFEGLGLDVHQGVPLLAVLGIVAVVWTQLNHEVVGVSLVVGLEFGHIFNLVIHLNQSADDAAAESHSVGFSLLKLHQALDTSDAVRIHSIGDIVGIVLMVVLNELVAALVLLLSVQLVPFFVFLLLFLFGQDLLWIQPATVLVAKVDLGWVHALWNVICVVNVIARFGLEQDWIHAFGNVVGVVGVVSGLNQDWIHAVWDVISIVIVISELIFQLNENWVHAVGDIVGVVSVVSKLDQNWVHAVRNVVGVISVIFELQELFIAHLLMVVTSRQLG